MQAIFVIGGIPTSNVISNKLIFFGVVGVSIFQDCHTNVIIQIQYYFVLFMNIVHYMVH
jgi:hypothetical protein